MPASVKIGILHDMADFTAVDGDCDEPDQGDLSGWIEREIMALVDAERLDIEVELIHAYALGLPSGTAEAVEQAYRQLASAGVVLIVGPAFGDNALIATPLAEQLRVPTINWAGADRARGRWMFQHQVGSHEDESLVIVRHLASLGQRRLAVIHDLSPAGTRHLRSLQEEAQVLEMEIVAREGVLPLGDDADSAVAAALAEKPDAIVYFGSGTAAPAISRALDAYGWSGSRIMNTAGLRGYRGDFAQRCDGWSYIDMHSDSNATLQAVMKRTGAARARALDVAKGHDIGRLVAEGLALAPDLSRNGVRIGLEQVECLPAAEGHEGTLLGFGVHDRAALHGRYLVVRQWLDGETREVA